MKQAAIATVADRLRLTWDEAAGIQARAVQRGLARRQAEPAAHLGIDDTAFVRRHQWSCPGLMDTWVKLPAVAGCAAAARKPGD